MELEFFEKGALAFEKKVGGRTKKLEQKIARLEKKLTQKNEVLSELMEEHRDQVVDFIRYWSDRSGIYGSKFIGWLGIAPNSLEEARLIVADFVSYYNTVRPHSALGYITPKDKLERRENEIFAARNEIFAARDRKLQEAREQRKARRRAQRQRAVAAGMRARYACA